MATALAKSRQIKLLLVGDKETGKHCFIRRLIEDRYPRDKWSNRDFDEHQFKIRLDHTEIPVQIFVVKGAARGKTALKKIYKNIDGYIVMFDVTNPESYDNVVGWKSDIDTVYPSNQIPPCIVVANKVDSEKDKDLEKQLNEIKGYCEALGFSEHFETSSKNGTGVRDSVIHLINQIRDRPERERLPSTGSDHGSEPDPTSRPKLPISIPNQEHILKIVVIGDIATGKTAIIQRYVKRTHSANYLPTIGVDIAQKKFQHGNDIINVHIWEVAGTERVGSVTHLFYRGAAGCLVVFDQSKIGTLNGAVKWKEDFDEKVNFDDANPVPCILVGNKSDLPKDGVIQNDAHMTQFWKTHQFFRWFQTSARDNTNINETFAFLIDQIMGNINQRTGVVRRPVDVIQPTNTSRRITETKPCC